MEPITLHPLGVLHTPYQSAAGMPIQAVSAAGVPGWIELEPAYAEGLTDVADFEYLFLIYHLHRVTRASLTVIPFLDTQPHGVFATRAPQRPNALGLSVVRLVAVNGLRLDIADVDMLDGTPLLDIKPYVPAYDVRATDRIGWYAGKLARLTEARADDRFTQTGHAKGLCMPTGSYINGEWFHPDSDQLVRNINPADTADVIAEFPEAQAADVRRAIEAAQAAWPAWKNTPGPERGRVLWRAADLARQRLDEIARTMTREEGKILKEARGEVLKGIALLEFYAGEGFRMSGKTLPSEARDTFTYTLRRPLGVVGLIAPWNFPWAIPVWKSAPALVAGNTVVFKPSELTPATAALLTEIYAAAGLPPGVFNMVVGTGASAGEAIVNAPALRAISFTGSNAVGRAVYVKAAQRGAKVTCEMGGKNAVIVLPDADLDLAAGAIHGGAFGSTGQRCTATSRVIAAPEIKAALIERLVASAERLKLGSGLEEGVDMGPAVGEKQWQTDLRYIALARQEGARLLTGGDRPAHLSQGYFVAPTIFDEVTPAMRLFREEVFGPVLGVTTARSLEEAISFANSVEYGLTASIFTQDIKSVMRFVEDTETGMVHVNEPTIGGEAQLPFGGTKSTGVGDREMAEEGLHFFTELKTVFINYAGGAERSLVR